jgi:hypothetical protein
MPNQRIVRVREVDLPITSVLIEPAYLTINPHTDMMVNFFAGNVIFKTDIGKIKIVDKPKVVNTYVHFAIT